MTTTSWADRVVTTMVLATGCLGLAFVLASSATVEAFDRLYDVHGAAGRDPAEQTYLQGVYGVLGAVMVGWMLVLHGLARGPLRRRERWAWQLTVRSVVAWFVLDSTISAFHVPRNVVLNVAVVIGFAVPLAAMRRELVDAAAA